MAWQAASGQNYGPLHRLHIQLEWLEMVKIFPLPMFDICVTLALKAVVEFFGTGKKNKETPLR